MRQKREEIPAKFLRENKQSSIIPIHLCLSPFQIIDSHLWLKKYPRFKKEETHDCVKYKITGWKLSE
jgi:hypothetical protein